MAYEHKEGRGSLLKNRDKRSNKSPDFTGDGMYCGKLVRLSAWMGKTANGADRISISIRPQQEDEEEPWNR